MAGWFRANAQLMNCLSCRLQLREEVEVLQHLSRAAGPEFHPNILGYVDSWEQDEQLYILTELCEYGNFAHFLSEYGLHFARLDEARVWKIFAEVSNVSVTAFFDGGGDRYGDTALLVIVWGSRVFRRTAGGSRQGHNMRYCRRRTPA